MWYQKMDPSICYYQMLDLLKSTSSGKNKKGIPLHVFWIALTALFSRKVKIEGNEKDGDEKLIFVYY